MPLATATTYFGFLLALCLQKVTAANNTRFHEFYPHHNAFFTAVRDNQCAAVYEAQQVEAENHWPSTLCTDLLDCILDHTTESIKGNMASAAVALGLMPTILTFLGNSTSETALLSRRRPLLSFLIACGSPAVSPFPTFTYQDPLAGLRAREGRLLPQPLSNLTTFWAIVIIFIEYILVLGATINVLTISIQIGSWTINTLACTQTFLPILWVVLAIFIHLFGIFAFALRVNNDQLHRSKHSLRLKVLKHLSYELTPCINQDKLVLQSKNESYLYMFISWFTSVGTVIHLLYGTIAFTSITFLGKFT